MKKTVYGIFAALTLCFAFAACDDDSSDIDRGTHAQLPEQAIAGSYVGIYTISESTSNDPIIVVTGTVDATITFAAGDSTYTAVFSSVCPTNSGLNGTDKIVNVTWSNDDIKFCYASNAKKAGSFSASDLNGICNADGTLSFKFMRSEDLGRGVMHYMYFQFKGERTE